MSFTDLPLATPCLSLCLSFKKVVAGDTGVVASGGATDTVVAAGGATATDTVVAAAGGTTDTVVATAGGATDATEVAAGGAPDTPGATAGGSTEEDKGGQKCTDNDNEHSNLIKYCIIFLCKSLPSDVERSNRCLDNMWKPGKL